VSRGIRETSELLVLPVHKEFRDRPVLKASRVLPEQQALQEPQEHRAHKARRVLKVTRVI